MIAVCLVRLLTDKLNRMSKRCELQKEYHREFGNYKGNGKYSDAYVKWLESKVLALNIQNVSECCERPKLITDFFTDNETCQNCGTQKKNVC